MSYFVSNRLVLRSDQGRRLASVILSGTSPVDPRDLQIVTGVRSADPHSYPLNPQPTSYADQVSRKVLS